MKRIVGKNYLLAGLGQYRELMTRVEICIAVVRQGRLGTGCY